MTPQLSRQLELNLTALSRAFRQALRFAQKNDPHGDPETSPAWKTVAARQALLLNMLEAVGPFLHSQPPTPEPSAPEPNATATADDIDEDLDEAALDAAAIGDFNIESALAMMPPDIQQDYEKFVAVTNWPTHTHPQRLRRTQELDRLRDHLDRRVQQWKAEALAQIRARNNAPAG